MEVADRLHVRARRPRPVNRVKKSPKKNIQISVKYKPQRIYGVHRQALRFAIEINGWELQITYIDNFALNWYPPLQKSDFAKKKTAVRAKSVFCNRYVEFEYCKRINSRHRTRPRNFYEQIAADKKLQRDVFTYSAPRANIGMTRP